MKIHQIGLGNSIQNLNIKTLNDFEKSLDESKNLIANTNTENTPVREFQNSSTSEDDNGSQFANSRTIIKP